MNSFGKHFRVTTFGESHGKAMGGIIDGFPAGFKVDFEQINKVVAERRPGSSAIVTQRSEPDEPEILSGFNEEGISLGTPIGFVIRNIDNRSRDYSEVKDKYRPNHADFTYDMKYGIHDYRGGGRSSARETANWVVAGAFAQQLLSKKGINVQTCLSAAGKVSYVKEITDLLSNNKIQEFSSALPEDARNKMEQIILEAKNEGDSIGGIVSCLITGVPAGIGDPVFEKLHAKLAQAMMSINAAKGFEYGLGFDLASQKGSDVTDAFINNEGLIGTSTNFSGGIQGGISNGMPIFFNVAFKPTPTIMKDLPTIDTDHNQTILSMKGRHDPCVAVRAVPVVKAMAALVLADFLS